MHFVPSFCCLVALAKYFVLKTPNFFFVAVSDQMLHADKAGKMIILHILTFKFLNPLFEMDGSLK